MADERLLTLPGAESIGDYDQSELVLQLTKGLYGIGIKTVQEIMPLPSIMPLPQLPEALMGVCRYRELILPVINLPMLLEESSEEPQSEIWQMVVISLNRRLCGLAVRDINEILNFSDGEVESLPAVADVQNEVFFRGIKRMGEEVVVLLRVDALLDYCRIPTRDQSQQVATAQSRTERFSIINMGSLRLGVNIEQIERVLRTPQVIPAGDDAPGCVKGRALNPEANSDQATESDYYPVLDLFDFLELEDFGGRRNLLLSSTSGRRVGFYSGVVEEIRDIDVAAIYRVPALAQTAANQFVARVALLGQEIVQLVDLNLVLTSPVLRDYLTPQDR